MTNAEKIKSIEYFQNCQHFHPLTCGNDSRHKPLIAVEREGRVVLICQNCDYVQVFIPPAALKFNEKT